MFWFFKKEEDVIVKSKQRESRKLIQQLCVTLSKIPLLEWQIEDENSAICPASFVRTVINAKLKNGALISVIRYLYQENAADGVECKYACYMDGVLVDSESYLSSETPPSASLRSFFEKILAAQLPLTG